MRLVRNLTFFAGLAVLTGCSNDSTSDLIGDPIPPGATITYSGNVAAIINNNCLGCHSNPTQNGAPMSLTTYEFVKQAIQNRGLLDRISRDQGAEGMMPLGGTRLPQSAIDIIEQWQQQGLQE
ncbi:hypothetical protein [Flavobacterium sp.]|uniref:hypothetical protein n=1 Tax=Flavobacterium sp. TaxID=239 RepID=UPI0039E304E7